MRLQHILLPAVVSAAVIENRQLGRTLNVVGTTKLEPEIDEKATHSITKFGPLTIKGKNGKQDSGQQNFMFTVPKGFCNDCTVLKGRIGLLNTDGTKISPNNDIYIHHILTYDTAKKAAPFQTCSTGSNALNALSNVLGAKFIGSGEDNNNVDVWYTNREGAPRGGYHIGANDKFSMQVDLVSYAPATKDIYLTMELEYLKGKVGEDSQETLLDVSMCGGRSVSAPASGPATSKSGMMKFTKSGTILVAKGHLHAGGDSVDVYVNNKLACQSKANYGGVKGPNAIDSMSLCTKTGIPVEKGDSMYFTVKYDATKHPVRHEAGSMMGDIMGMLDVTFASSA